MGDIVSQVVFTPDGKRALATKFTAHKVSLLDVNGDKVTYTKLDLPTGLWPYNVAVAPSGKIALTADNGGAGSSDGSVDTVSVVDLEANPPRIIDRVVVGDGPEGLAISPKGDVAVAAILRGSNMKKAYYYHKNGSISVLRIDGKKVTKVKEVEVGGLPEAAVFTPDGNYLLVGNYLDSDFSILKVDGTKVTDTGKRFKVPGHPASVRMGAKRAGRLRMHRVDIGPTRKWGHPLGDESKARWPQYAQAVWQAALPQPVDFVLIDGRFRVACALMARLKARPDALVAFHDFWTRLRAYGANSAVFRRRRTRGLARHPGAAAGSRPDLDRDAASAIFERSCLMLQVRAFDASPTAMS